jgi:hypothetical protein
LAVDEWVDVCVVCRVVCVCVCVSCVCVCVSCVCRVRARPTHARAQHAACWTTFPPSMQACHGLKKHQMATMATALSSAPQHPSTTTRKSKGILPEPRFTRSRRTTHRVKTARCTHPHHGVAEVTQSSPDSLTHATASLTARTQLTDNRWMNGLPLDGRQTNQREAHDRHNSDARQPHGCPTEVVCSSHPGAIHFTSPPHASH